MATIDDIQPSAPKAPVKTRAKLNSLPITLLLTYQAEYENTPDLTVEQICEKYCVNQGQLKGWQTWEKVIHEDIEVMPVLEPSVAKVAKVDTSSNYGLRDRPLDIPQLPDTIDTTLTPEDTPVLKDIAQFKELAVAHALKFMRNDAEFAEVKEFKDMVAIVDSLEKSYIAKKNPDDAKITVNIAIQNLVERFRDDC
jgi:hypothetical protein